MLLDRIAAIESTRKQAVYSSYFPQQESCNQTTGSRMSDAQTYNVGSHGCCCCHCQPRCFRDQNSSSDIHSKLDKILRFMEGHSNTNEPSNFRAKPTDKTENIKASLRPKPPDNCNDPTSDTDSIISIDRFMPDSYEAPLNSKELTSRSQSPMLQN